MLNDSGAKPYEKYRNTLRRGAAFGAELPFGHLVGGLKVGDVLDLGGGDVAENVFGQEFGVSS